MNRQLIILALAALVLSALPAMAADAPGPGDALPTLTLNAEGLPAEEAAALGIAGQGSFAVSNIDADYVLLEIIGVYCPQCHEQAPLFNRLHGRLERTGLGKKVKMLAVAAGGYPAEVDFLRSEGTYLFPVVADTDYAAHKALGEPKTPYTMIVDAGGKVVWAHLGVISDVDALYARLAELAK